MEQITDREKLQKIVDSWNNGYREYESQKESHNDLVEAIRTATNGTFIGENYSTTLLGYSKEFDSKGREITADPNYKDSTINIEGITYPITRVGWKAYIWKPNSNASYTKCWGDDKYCCLLTEVDLRPDYVKEYYKSKGKEDKPFVWKDYYVENDYIVNPIRENHGKVFDNGHIMWITKPVEPKVIHAPYIINEPTILI